MKASNDDRSLHVVVAVLGDVGRSPRMQYHALSLLEEGHTVSLVGYEGEELVPPLQNYLADPNNRLHIIRFRTPSLEPLRKILPLYFLLRMISMSMYVCWAFFRIPTRPAPDCIIVQNPPAIPLLLISFIYCRTIAFVCGKRTGFIIDWHNLGYSMLHSGKFRQLAKMYERTMAPLADGHLTVTMAMKNFLIENMGIADGPTVQILHDCPPSMFRPLSLEEQHQILRKVDKELCSACPRSWLESINYETQTLFTENYDNNKYRPRRGRPALLVSSTSWTPDEDFSILLDALEGLDSKIETERSSLKCMVVVTGKGPQKQMYQEKISRLGLHHVVIQTLWLEPGDYPKLLACADLGVSLHTSTSGLDLPMKVLDLFGCETPVCAVNFACLSELVQDDVNGRIFENSSELTDILWVLLEPLTKTPDAPNHSFGVLDRYSKGLRGRCLWHENWMAHASKVIRAVAPSTDG